MIWEFARTDSVDAFEPQGAQVQADQAGPAGHVQDPEAGPVARGHQGGQALGQAPLGAGVEVVQVVIVLHGRSGGGEKKAED